MSARRRPRLWWHRAGASRRRGIGVLLLLLSSCSTASDDPAPAQPGDAGAFADAADVGASGEAIGRFQLTLVRAIAASGEQAAAPAYTSLLGRVYEAEVPPDIVWTVTAEEGDCELLEPSIPACDPTCAGDEICAEGGRCVAYPRSLAVGTATLRGLQAENGQEAIAMNPLPPSNTYQLPGSVRLAYPPFAQGDPIALEAEGGELAAFSIQAAAIAPLEPTIDGPIRFAPDGATELSWDPPASGSTARVHVIVDISHHGGQKGEIRCETEDSGALAIPAALAAQLIDLGVAGFPTLQIVREATGSARVGERRVELALSSPVTLELEIPGLVSCDEPGTQDVCPDGQQCEQDRRCQ
jgi:hypothetical protein